MRNLLVTLTLVTAVLPMHSLRACPPPPPGYVEPTPEERLRRSLSDTTDVVYGVVRRGAEPGKSARFEIFHVYRGEARKGDVVDAPFGWGHPVPQCVGMYGPAPALPVGAYGVIAFASTAPELNFIKPEDVQVMIRQGWIRSARAR